MNTQTAAAYLTIFPALALLGILGHTPTVIAQTSAVQDNSVAIPIEEIVVIGKKSAFAMRRDIRRLDREISEQLNALIDDEYYQLTCSRSRRTGARVRQYRCQPGYELVARQIAYREASALSALDQLSLDTFDEPDVLILTEETRSLTEVPEVSINSFGNTDVVLQTELQRSDEEFQNIVFNLARNNPQLAEKLVRRYYLQLALAHKKENWWRNLFGQEVETFSIPTAEIRLTNN